MHALPLPRTRAHRLALPHRHLPDAAPTLALGNATFRLPLSTCYAPATYTPACLPTYTAYHCHPSSFRCLTTYARLTALPPVRAFLLLFLRSHTTATSHMRVTACATAFAPTEDYPTTRILHPHMARTLLPRATYTPPSGTPLHHRHYPHHTCPPSHTEWRHLQPGDAL